MNRPSTSTHAPGRIAAAAAILLGFCLFATVAAVNVPYEAGDAELLSWWQDGSNTAAGLISMAFAVLTAVLLSVLGNHLVLLAGDRSPRLAAFARSMVGAFTATMLVAASLRGVIGHLTDVQGDPLPGIDVLRYTTALNYAVLGVAGMGSLALAVLALGALVLRTGVLARWAGLVSLACGAVVLLAVVALAGSLAVPVAILWAWSTGVAVLRAPVVVTTNDREQIDAMTP